MARSIITFKDLSFFETIQNSIAQAELIVDGLFGSGLSSSLEGPVLKVVELINAATKPVVSIDIPSGIETNSGACLETAIWATYTVTFSRVGLRTLSSSWSSPYR